MKVLVTGGAVFIGSHLVNYPLNIGDKVTRQACQNHILDVQKLFDSGWNPRFNSLQAVQQATKELINS